MIERKIIIGVISSTNYIQQVRQDIKPELMESSMARLLCNWAIEYFDEYKKAPEKSIETIYFEKLKKGNIPKEVAEEIEDDILPELSDELIKDGIDVDYLVEKTRKYFQERQLILLQQNIENCLNKNDIKGAEQLIEKHKQKAIPKNELILNSDKIKPAVREAFTTTFEPVLTYPGAVGKFWNRQMVRGGFISFMAPEKRGKTTQLIDAALRGVHQKRKVAFFQAGDMTEGQTLHRVMINLLRKTDNEKHLGINYFPVKDCVKNQLNICNKNIRESSFGVFEDRGWNEKMLRDEVTYQDLKEAYKDNPDYKTCYNCSAYKRNDWGAVWLASENIKQLTVQEAEKKAERWFKKKDRQLRIATYPNGTLSVSEISAVLNSWEMTDGFIPDIIIVDYADLLVPEKSGEFRHQQNQIWKDLRGLNQRLNCLLITATMTDSKSYKQKLITLDNFNEDKRKYGHVTAMYGLNQDPSGREKEIGIMRINEILLREDEFNSNKCITLLQGLKLWKPILSSYF